MTRSTGHNMCFDLEWHCHFAGAKSQIVSSVQGMRFSGKIRPLHKAQSRWPQQKLTTT
jgi:hypothetical protein